MRRRDLTCQAHPKHQSGQATLRSGDLYLLVPICYQINTSISVAILQPLNCP